MSRASLLHYPVTREYALSLSDYQVSQCYQVKCRESVSSGRLDWQLLSSLSVWAISVWQLEDLSEFEKGYAWSFSDAIC